MYSLSTHGEPLLTSAVYSHDPHTVQALLKLGYNINWKVGNTRDTGINLFYWSIKSADVLFSRFANIQNVI